MDGGGEIGGPKVRPHPRQEAELSVRALPEQEVAQPLLASGADQKVHVGGTRAAIHRPEAEGEGLAILLIEQNLGVATSIAERQLVMVAGSIFAETTATDLQRDPELQRRFLGVEPLRERA